jgi:putative ABC transport system permease protein
VKHSSYYKDILRQIWRTRSRFLSIFAIIALGTGFFAGLKATTPDMKQTAQAYFSDKSDGRSSEVTMDSARMTLRH